MFFDVIPYFGYSPYQMSILFVFWSFCGWIVDVLGVALDNGEYSNRGFLSMPICPIYGFGVLFVTILLKPFFDNTLLLFLLSMILCTALELLTGLLLQFLFHNIWWDYRNEPFNFMGLICLKCSLFWGAACVFVENLIEPSVESVIAWIPIPVGMGFICLMAILITIDTVNSVSSVIHLNLRLKEISEISQMLYDNSQILGKAIADTALTVTDAGMQMADKLSGKAVTTKDSLKARFDSLISFNDKNIQRMIKAFPKMRSLNYHDAFEQIKHTVLRNKRK